MDMMDEKEKKEKEEKYEAALSYAAKQLSYRALSCAKLREKLLAKGHKPEAADYALAWLAERKLLDDSVYVENLVEQYRQRGYGVLRIRQELYARGISEQDAQQALTGFAPNQKQMLVLLAQRLRGDLSNRREVDKAAAALSRRGFRWPEIREALETYRAQLERTNTSCPEES